MFEAVQAKGDKAFVRLVTNFGGSFRLLPSSALVYRLRSDRINVLRCETMRVAMGWDEGLTFAK